MEVSCQIIILRHKYKNLTGFDMGFMDFLGVKRK